MSALAQVRYKEDYIADFERRKSTLVHTVRNDAQDRGGSLVYLVAGSGARSTVTRGANGSIPPSDDSQTQTTLTFVEDIDYVEKTAFNIFTAQGDQLAIMRNESIGVIHRKQDARIITALEGGTVDLGVVGAMSKAVVNRIATILGNADVGTDDDMMSMFGALTPAAWIYLTENTSFASADYVNFSGMSPTEEGLPPNGRFKNWMGINWCQHGGLTGKGTSTATCLAWHRNAAGYAMSTRGIDAQLDYDPRQDMSWRRTTVFQAAVKLQNSGIVKFTHDDSGISS